ncbi:uncharacterized protein PV07_04258 [Cladophialophora immunda]|uniref:N-acetyltransferase domain-containing protein n=1 Tax=Cladophialophora immunda TaxID=569365 RepID=A0A0D2CRX9_9EURO|nr:uncharacterized protein PV07_04258 [Cladophialophora immunda]KIW32730.1 hypothetical protein PV07_04258 [Cladophialophora immunda]OQU95296.1 Acetyltransferase GNAT domain-containing protein [Cladophialophora immunda]
MDTFVLTPRLKLILVTTAERGSLEFEWLHQLHSNEKATWWSIYGRAKSIEDTEKVSMRYLPTKEAEAGQPKTYRAVYTVHRMLDPLASSGETEPQAARGDGISSEFIGLITLKSLDPDGLVLPEELTLPAAAASTTLTVELAYMFLPTAWGQGYATESLGAVFESCKRARSFWTPFSKLYVRAIVNEDNPASMRVMDKTRMTKRGVHTLTGRTVFLAGEWRDRHSLHIFGMHLIE